MADLTLTVSADIRSADKIQTLIELLDKNRENLPVELIESLNDLADCKACEIGVDQVIEIAGKSLPDSEFEYSGLPSYVDHGNICSFNPILKRVTYNACEKGVAIQKCYPEHLKATVNGFLICEW